MTTSKKFFSLCSLCSLFLLSSACVARADSIDFAGLQVVSGNGFGNDPRSLSISNGNNPSEQGCIAPSGSGIIAGKTSSAACAGTGAGVPEGGDAVALVGGNEDPPISSGSSKEGAPSLTSLGITDASQIWILFDAVAPTGGPPTLTVNDLTLKLYDPTTDTLLYTVNLDPSSCPNSTTSCSIPTNPGNGHSDYYFNLDAAAAGAMNTIITASAAGYGDIIALDSEITIAGGGSESYALVNKNQLAMTPEPSTLVLLGTGIVGMAALLRRRMKTGDHHT